MTETDSRLGWWPRYYLGTDRIENIAPNNYSIVLSTSFAEETCLLSPYEAMTVLVSHHDTVHSSSSTYEYQTY
jgi:hypothetical protein